MNTRINRRDFLKYAGALPMGYAASKLLRFVDSSRQSEPKNVIIIVFDAFSAYHISLYGYERETTPNITRLAQRAIRYHNHFAGGNFTTPGTASLLTGVLPWTHRAINLNGNVLDRFSAQNIFTALPAHYRIAYTHNPLANRLLTQFESNIDMLIPRESLYLKSYDTFISTLFKNDDDIASISWVRAMKVNEEGSAYSLFLSHLYEIVQANRIEGLKPQFPRGIPAIGQTNPFLLETALNSITERLKIIPEPFLGYFHLMPPHQPYRTEAEFYNAFSNDGFAPLEKTVDILAKQNKVFSQAMLEKFRTEYDEFILYCDNEFDKFFNKLESSGILKNTWLIVTSDHGELFERGIFGHDTKVLYQPVVRVPLMIFEPGRVEGMDIHTPTSAVDVLPTVAYLTGQEPPAWVEGTVLPPFASTDSNHDIYTVQAIKSNPNAPLDQVSLSMVRDNFKLHYYRGYEETSGEDIVRLFDIQSDPEEMTDLARTKSDTASELLNQLKASLAEADRPFAS